MKRKIVHLLALPLLLCAVVTGCRFPVARASQTGLGGLRILKTDTAGRPLAGAVYRLAREATFDELMDSGTEKDMLLLGDRNITVVYARFLETADGSRRTGYATTDEKGEATMYGLPYGSYYLVEHKSPEGYSRMEKPVRVGVSKYSHLTDEDNVRDDSGEIIDNTIHIITVRYTLPDTGNRKLAAAAGGAVLSGALLLFLGRRSRR